MGSGVSLRSFGVLLLFIGHSMVLVSGQFSSDGEKTVFDAKAKSGKATLETDDYLLKGTFTASNVNIPTGVINVIFNFGDCKINGNMIKSGTGFLYELINQTMQFDPTFEVKEDGINFMHNDDIVSSKPCTPKFTGAEDKYTIDINVKLAKAIPGLKIEFDAPQAKNNTAQKAEGAGGKDKSAPAAAEAKKLLPLWIALGVLGVFGVLGIICFCVYWFWYRPKHKDEKDDEDDKGKNKDKRKSKGKRKDKGKGKRKAKGKGKRKGGSKRELDDSDYGENQDDRFSRMNASMPLPQTPSTQPSSTPQQLHFPQQLQVPQQQQAPQQLQIPQGDYIRLGEPAFDSPPPPPNNDTHYENDSHVTNNLIPVVNGIPYVNGNAVIQGPGLPDPNRRPPNANAAPNTPHRGLPETRPVRMPNPYKKKVRKAKEPNQPNSPGNIFAGPSNPAPSTPNNEQNVVPQAVTPPNGNRGAPIGQAVPTIAHNLPGPGDQNNKIPPAPATI
ncbi:hypothetical protein M3Y96_00408700 [Aphelenchoides besseyi]|nr:hypothetical protein M3Y96_00408700 [Aphelenchoides besseyi]